MAVPHEDIREWQRVKLGLGEQVNQATPLTTLPKWFWADTFGLGERPQYDTFGGAFGGVHFPRGANRQTHSLPGGRFRFGATQTLLNLILPWVTQGVFTGSSLDYSLGINRYFTIGIEDEPVGRHESITGAVPSNLTLESSLAGEGILKGVVDVLGEGFTDATASSGALIFTEAAPSDLDTYRHRDLVVLADGIQIGVASVAINLPTGVFAYTHNSKFPLNRKDGGLNIIGEMESTFNKETDKLRRNANGEIYATLSFTWTNSVSGSLAIVLSDAVFTLPSDTGIEGRRYVPFRGTLTNFGVPSIDLVA